MQSLYLIDLVPSMSFSFSLTFSSFIEVNSDKEFGSTLEAIDEQCSKWRLNVAEFKAELHVDVLHSVCQ